MPARLRETLSGLSAEKEAMQLELSSLRERAPELEAQLEAERGRLRAVSAELGGVVAATDPEAAAREVVLLVKTQGKATAEQEESARRIRETLVHLGEKAEIALSVPEGAGGGALADAVGAFAEECCKQHVEKVASESEAAALRQQAEEQSRSRASLEERLMAAEQTARDSVQRLQTEVDRLSLA